MRLLSAPLSPFAARVRLAIYHKGLDIEIVPPPSEGLTSPAYHAINPMGQIPCLELKSGMGVPDSEAILEYLEDVFPTPSLRPANVEDLARARLFMRIPDVQLNSARRILLSMRDPADRKAELVEPAIQNIERALNNIQSFLDDREGHWAVGDRASIADCALAPVVNAVSLVAVTQQAAISSRLAQGSTGTRARTRRSRPTRVISEQCAAVP